MKIWIVLEADEVDYSSAFGYSKPISYFLSEEDAIAEYKRLGGGLYYHYEELDIDIENMASRSS